MPPILPVLAPRRDDTNFGALEAPSPLITRPHDTTACGAASRTGDPMAHLTTTQRRGARSNGSDFRHAHALGVAH